MLQNSSFFYLQIAQLLEAGIAFIEALRSCSDRCPPAMRQQLKVATRYIEGGKLPHDAFADAGFSKLVVTMLRVAGQTGDFPGCFRQLSEQEQKKADLRQKIMSRMAYPAFLAIVAPLLLNLPMIFTTSLKAYLWQVSWSYLQLALVIGGAYAVHRLLAKNHVYVAILNAIPYLGKLRIRLSLTRFCNAAAALFEAGVFAEDALLLAAEATNNEIHCQQVVDVLPGIAAGKGVYDQLRGVPWLPALVLEFVETGEMSGKLPESLKQLEKIYRSELERQLETLAKVLPAIVYGYIVCNIAYKILSFYMNHYGRMMNF